MIDVIIPAYNAHDTIIKTLSSIALQTIKDNINVYIVDDCSLIGYDKEVKLFKDKLNIKLLKMEKNSGPGLARQYAIDNSDGKYILFIDADDLFFDCYSVENLYNAIELDNYDKVTGIEVEQTDDYIYEYPNNQCNLHAIMYKREFIKKYNFSFNDTNKAEDEAYNKLLLLANPKSLVIDNYIYLYCNNKNSITRKEPNFWFYFIETYVKNMVWTAKEAENRNFNAHDIAYHLIREYLKTYFSYLTYFDREDSNLILKWCKPLHEYYLKYSELLTNQEIRQLYVNGIFDMSTIPKISFNEFLYRVDLYNFNKR